MEMDGAAASTSASGGGAQSHPYNHMRSRGVCTRDDIENAVKVEDRISPLTTDTPAMASPGPPSASCSSDVPCESIQETPDYIRRSSQRNQITPIGLFQDRGSDGYRHGSPTVATMPELHSEVQPLDRNGSLLASLELWETPVVKDVIKEDHSILLSINAGGIDGSIVCGGVDFQRDEFFTGGDVITTDAQIGDSNGLELYQSARYGNFAYKFENLEAGDYLVDIHLAEIVFTDGPSGMRVFDVFIQEEKVVSNVDIYAQVGSNQPLILSDLRALVYGQGSLSVRLEGVVGKPLVCGISVRRDYSAGKSSRRQIMGSMADVARKNGETLDTEEIELENRKCWECRKLKQKYDLLLKEQLEIKREMDGVKQENELKSREGHEAWMSLQELQSELMCKSMHVGSLAFAVEGQVKEKSRWFLCLQDLSNKFKMLKVKHAKLSEEALEYRRCLADMTHITNTIHLTMHRHVNLESEYKDLKMRFLEEAKERKDLYNKLIELKGNIRVFCRCRPPSTEEIAAGASTAVDFESAKDGDLTIKVHGISKKVFKFDTVFSPEEDQEKVFEKTAPFATSVLDGYNVCIFAYGQTGTGKTFTMQGTEEARGVNYRTLEELFRIINERQGLFRYEITVSALEVYNEQIHDLLLSGSQPGVAAKRLEVRQVAEGTHHVPGLVEAHVNNMNEVWDVLQTGSKARAVGATNANEHSSRSHCIHCVMVRAENLMNGECTRSKLWLIDLAGSERVAKTDAQGERLKEAQSINRSLSALGDVISALSTKSLHIPFRNSKLTHLLQDSLGGDSKTLMFVQISPNENDVGETLCSLNFASRVRGIELGPAKRQVDGGEVFRYKQMVEKTKQDNKNKEVQIKKMEETIHSLEMKNKAKDFINKNLQEKIKELESQLLIERRLARQHVDTKIAEQQQQQNQEQKIPSAIPLLATQPLSEKNLNNVADQLIAFKELGNATRPLTENSNKITLLPPDAYIIQHYPLLQDKENRPELGEEEPLPRKASRISLCTTARQAPYTPATRRNSLNLLPSIRTALPQCPLLPNTRNPCPPLPTPLPAIVKDVTWQGESSSRKPRSTRKLNSILCRSLQKKVIIRSPLQQNIRRGGTLGIGLEKVRVSIGGSARKARRVVVSNGTRTDRELQQKRQQKGKERGWNHGSAITNIF